MIKICFVTTIYLTYKSFLKEFSEYLHKTGEYDISLICNDEEGLLEDLPEYVHYYPVSMKRGVSLSIFSAKKKIAKILKEHKFDIVQYSTPNAAFAASSAAKKVKCPVRLYCQWGIRYMGLTGIARKIFKWLEKTTCKNSTHIEAESFNIRDFAISEGLYKKEKSQVVWNGSACGVNLNKFDINKKSEWRKDVRERLGYSEEDVVFSFAARLTVDKGVNELLSAFKNIEEKNKHVKLLVMGGNDNSELLDQELLSWAKNSKNVTFTGSVNNVQEYYAGSDVFVAPSYREGFGLVVIEAEGMGLPAIVSNVPGQIDAIEENKTGLACEVKSASSLADCMQKLIDDEKLRTEMGENAYNFVKDNYEQNKLFEKLSDIRIALANKKEN